MADIKKVTFGSLIEEFDPDEKSSPEFDIITGKFPVEDLASFYESGIQIWALENLSFRGRLFLKTGEKVKERHIKELNQCNGKFLYAKLKRGVEKVSPEVFQLISTYKQIKKEDVEKYPLINLNQSNLPESKKKEIRDAIFKKYSHSRKSKIELFNSICQNKINPNEPLFTSNVICKTKMGSNLGSKPEKVILAIDISGSTVIDNLNYFVQILARQVKNHIENLLGLPVDVIFFHDKTIPLQKAICINDFGGTIYQYPFEYCLKEAEKSKVDFILISDGMPNDDSKVKDLAKKFKGKGINYFQIIFVHPLQNIMESYSLGSYPEVDSEESFFRYYETVFEEICKNAGGSQIVIRFPEFLYYMLIDIYNQ
jgi:hypothetical protein